MNFFLQGTLWCFGPLVFSPVFPRWSIWWGVEALCCLCHPGIAGGAQGAAVVSEPPCWNLLLNSVWLLVFCVLPRGWEMLVDAAQKGQNCFFLLHIRCFGSFSANLDLLLLFQLNVHHQRWVVLSSAFPFSCLVPSHSLLHALLSLWYLQFHVCSLIFVVSCNICPVTIPGCVQNRSRWGT